MQERRDDRGASRRTVSWAALLVTGGLAAACAPPPPLLPRDEPAPAAALPRDEPAPSATAPAPPARDEPAPSEPPPPETPASVAPEATAAPRGPASTADLWPVSALRDAQRKTASVQARQVRDAALMFLMQHGDDTCPAVDSLVVAGLLARAARDPWGGGYAIVCADGDVTVTSPGPDGAPATQDDIVVR